MTPAAYGDLHLFIDGEWIGVGGRRTEAVVNPATGEAIGRLPLATPADLDRALESAQAGFAAWRQVSAFERGKVLRRAGQLLRDRSGEIAVQLTLEQGKPVAQARQEVLSSADFFDWYAEEARRAYGRVIPPRNAGATLTALKEPVGVVAAFSPWNFPVSQAARKLAPAIAAGCAVILKPSEETPGSTLAMARALHDAGLPKGVLNVVFGVPAEVSEQLIASPIVRKVSFTGSTPVGKIIGKLAAEGVKRVTMELGGHGPVIVCDDVDADKVAVMAAVMKYRNAGQICTSPTRFYVQDKAYDRFVETFVQAARAVVVGDGLDDKTQMGPLANARRVEAMQRLTVDAVALGGRVLAGGEPVGNRGYFWTPTVLADAPDSARAMNEEPFGPLALMRRIDSLEEGVAAANRLPYGLAAYAFTRDMDRAAYLRDGLECGLLGFNTFLLASAETPFGGVKESGYGSEGGPEGLDAYHVTKFVSQG
jgi:succinate-semialdehyde dehydrogenase/glutarate-semialdehyde dehydrogenase